MMVARTGRRELMMEGTERRVEVWDGLQTEGDMPDAVQWMGQETEAC